MNERMRVLLLLAVSVLVYTNALPNGFTYDDQRYILHNQAVRAFSVQALLRPAKANNVFRPLTFFTFALNWAVEGAQPLGYHFVNLLLHAAVVVLLYLLLRTLLESVPHAATIAFATGLLFAVHPLHTEAVASIAGRSELLAAGFLLAAWLLHLRDFPVPALLCFLCALLSKESAMAFVPLVLAGDYVRNQWKPIWRYASILAAAGLFLLLFWKIEGGRFGEKSISFIDNPLASLPAQLRILNALRIAWKYLGLLVYPHTLSYDYSYNAILLYAGWSHCAPTLLATLVLFVLWAWALWSRRTAWFLAGAIYLCSFAVVANIIVPTGTIMGERLAYLPSAGFCLLVALPWSLLQSRKPTSGWVLLALFVALLGARTVVRNRDWQNNLTLFASGVQAVPGSARAHMNLADEYMNRGQLQAAATEFQVALRIYPHFPEAMENYGLLQSRMGLDQEAAKALETALSMVQRGDLDYPFMEVNLAGQLMKLGRNDEALGLLNHGIAERPGYSPAWSNRAVIHYQRNEVPAARADAEMALQLDPWNQQARTLLSVLSSGRQVPPAQ